MKKTICYSFALCILHLIVTSVSAQTASNGSGFSCDPTAVDNLQAKATRGDGVSARHLGVFFGQGKCGEKNEGIAFAWFLLGATFNDALSQYQVAQYYYWGMGIPKDVQQAFYWYDRSAKQGVVGSMMMLVSMYEEGKGTARDLAEAFYWLVRANDNSMDLAREKRSRLYDALSDEEISRISKRISCKLDVKG